MEKQIGIYKITNKVNNHCYIGQSRNIAKRWIDHCSAANSPIHEAYEYPLYRAIRKYGIQNFSFEILEFCSINELNEKEQYWIKILNPEFNQTIGENYNIIPQKLTFEQVKDIQNILLQDTNGEVSHTQLAKEYQVSKDTIRDINVGRTWFNENYSYPLHYSKYDADKPKEMKKIYFCVDCGKEISKGSIRCNSCEGKRRKTLNKNYSDDAREKLKKEIRTMSFLELGKKYGVSDNAIRKRCIALNLPSKKKDINSYTDAEWEQI